MKHIEQSDVAGETWNRLLNILTAKVNVPVAGCDATSLSCFPQVDIKSENRSLKSAFPQIKRQQTNSAADIQDRFVRGMKQFVSGRINGIAAQFASHIPTEPALWKLGDDAGTSRLMFVSIPLA